jgi:hypothetical protein
MPMDPLVGHDPEFRLKATLTLAHQAGPSGRFAMKTGRYTNKRYVSEPLYPRGGPAGQGNRVKPIKSFLRTAVTLWVMSPADLYFRRRVD